jgi:hypothetical protein
VVFTSGSPPSGQARLALWRSGQEVGYVLLVAGPPPA